jgi:hypothetical protein
MGLINASASSLSMGCEYAWKLRYIDHIRFPEKAWDDPTASSGQRSRALGGAVHKVLENYYQGIPNDWTTFPAKIAQSGMHLLPTPAECVSLAVERDLSLRIGDVHFRGRKDLRVILNPAGALRLNLPVGEPILFDYKTTKAFRWAKSASYLALEDTQAAIYALDEAVQRRVTTPVRMAWVYFLTDTKRDAMRIDYEVSIEHACACVVDLTKYATYLRTRKEYLKYPSVCGAYGGCDYAHMCDKIRRVGTAIARNTE